MKRLSNLQSLLTIVILWCSSNAVAYDFEVDGIYYNITDDSLKNGRGNNWHYAQCGGDTDMDCDDNETMLLLCWLKHTAKYKWALANLVVSLRLNTFTKIDLEKWLNEPFTPPRDTQTIS